MLCEVLKPINGPDGVVLRPGDHVDVSTWKWSHQLIEQRKLRPVTVNALSNPEVEAEVAVPKRGRPRKINTN